MAVNSVEPAEGINEQRPGLWRTVRKAALVALAVVLAALGGLGVSFSIMGLPR